MFASRPPAVSTHGGALSNPGYYGQTSPTGELRGAVGPRGYYRAMTLPQWHVRTIAANHLRRDRTEKISGFPIFLLLKRGCRANIYKINV